MQEQIYSDFGSKSPNLNEIFGDSDRYDYTKVLGQGAYGIVWYSKINFVFLIFIVFLVQQKINILTLK